MSDKIIKYISWKDMVDRQVGNVQYFSHGLGEMAIENSASNCNIASCAFSKELRMQCAYGEMIR